jgi:hypothetical protein
MIRDSDAKRHVSVTPTLELGVRAKHWWTRELNSLRKNANKTGRKASKYKDWPDHPIHEERRKANRLFKCTLEHTKRQHWRDWLERALDLDIWTAHKYTSAPASDGGKSRIPVLKLMRDGQDHTATSNEEKARLLARTFFPPRPPDESPLPSDYPKPVCKFDHINRDQIMWQLAKLKPYIRKTM